MAIEGLNKIIKQREQQYGKKMLDEDSNVRDSKKENPENEEILKMMYEYMEKSLSEIKDAMLLLSQNQGKMYSEFKALIEKLESNE